MKKKSNLLEHIVHGIFLILGLITVACVLVITVYLVVSGIPAIKEIGLIAGMPETTRYTVMTSTQATVIRPRIKIGRAHV